MSGTPYDDLITASSQNYGVPVSWIEAVIQVESAWNPNAYRAEPQISDASYGLMQLLTKTAAGLGFSGDPSALYDPATNIDLGTKLLRQLRSSYGDDFQRVYSAYNSGKPDLYLTSSQVAANVGRAVAALTQYVSDDVTQLISATGMPADSVPPVAALVVLVLLLMWVHKKGH